MTFINIPLDSRPCNLRFPKQIAAMAGVKLLQPSQMDHFTTPADYNALVFFLQTFANRATHLVISLDHWCYGSLLASREPDVSFQEALSRLNTLEKILQAHPHMKVSAYSVIMRSSISTLCKEDLPYYQLMTAYSQQWHQAKLTCTQMDQEKLKAIMKSIPPWLLQRYNAVRSRNHAVNQRAITLCHAGFFDKLLLLQEDSQSLGFHRVEQEALVKAIAKDMRIHLHNGTDEAGMLLVADAVRNAEKPLKLRVSYLQGNGAFIPMFEDRPFSHNVASHCKAIGIQLTEVSEDCVLCIVVPENGVQTDRLSENGSIASASSIKQVLYELDKGKPVALLDVQYVNGGDGYLLNALGQQILSKLAGYAAWNTACNSLGTVLAQLRSTSGKASELSSIFTIERLLDDYLYQSVVRSKLQAQLEVNGEDIYHLKNRTKAEAALQILFHDALDHYIIPDFPNTRIAVSLPWERTFEADIRLTKNKGV